MTTYRRGAGAGLLALFRGRSLNRGAAWGMMIIGALLAFEIFNFSTTQFALRDVLGDLTFAGMRWATILAVAFCGIDFAGIARHGQGERAEIAAEVERATAAGHLLDDGDAATGRLEG